jgi:beta-galactosidase GanA
MVFSGEFHPYRLPVPDLWLDVFQKVKALGFNAVSFYVHWALLEGQPGHYTADGVFAFEPFFDAAQKAGIYLVARPGPVSLIFVILDSWLTESQYINAESSGGGFPGWLQRIKGQLRTRAPDYLAATDNYMANIGATIAKAQITNGGPVILVQPENEYTGSSGNITGGFPDPVYFAYVKKQLRDAGIVVPLINNDAGKLSNIRACFGRSNEGKLPTESLLPVMWLMGLLRAMLTFTATTHTPLALIVQIHTPGLPEIFQPTSMLPTRSKARRRSTL